MPKLSPALRRRLILLGVLAAIAAAGAVALTLRHQARQRRSEACHRQREAISRFRRDSFDAPLQQMRQMRLNPEQVTTLRQVDPAAYDRYAQAYGDQVDRVARAAEELGSMVDSYRSGDCLAVP